VEEQVAQDQPLVVRNWWKGKPLGQTFLLLLFLLLLLLLLWRGMGQIFWFVAKEREVTQKVPAK